MKNLLSILCILIATSFASAQNAPTLVDWEIDTLCNGTTDTQVMNIQIEDLDADSTWIQVTSYDFVIYSFVAEDPAPPLVGGQTIRTFSIYGMTGTGIPNGLNLSDIGINIYSDNGSDGTGPWPATITNAAAYGDMTLSFDMSSAGLCDNDQPVDLNQWVSPVGGEFEWGAENHEGHMFDPVLYLEDPSNITYIYTNAAECEYYVSETPIFNSPALVSMIENPSTCGNADGSADLFITGGTGPYTLYWSTGTTVNGATSNETLNNLPSGTYYANVINSFGCKATISARISDSDISITPTINNANCYDSFDGSIDLAISGSGNVDDIWWSTGATTANVSGLKRGEYTVEVHMDNNCHAYKEFVVTSPPKIDVDMMSINPADCSDGVTYGNSGITISTSGGAGGYMWDWNDGAFNTENISSIPSGPYKCVVSDANGCELEWWVNLPEFNGPQLFVKKIKKTACGLEDGLIDLDIFAGVSPIISTLWDNGATTEDMVDAHAGVFKVDVTDAAGCVTTGRYKIPTYRPPTPQICLLTVDTTLTYNTVVWEKDVTQGDIASFNIYRETTTVGEYELISNRDYSLESVFQDNVVSAMDRSWRYYITAVDTCGFESFPSFPHKTIHCVTQPNGPNTDVYWDTYEGINYSSVDIHRYDDVNGWVTIEPGWTGGAPYADAPQITAGLDYMVTFNLAQTCTSSKAQDYNNSRSNRTGANFNPGGSTVAIEDEEVGKIAFYPNPTNDDLNVFIENMDSFDYIVLLDASGKVISNQSVNSNLTYIEMENLTNGLYIVKLLGPDKTINQKIIKE